VPSGLYRRGLDGKLPVNKGEVIWAGRIVVGFPNPEALFIRAILIPFWEQNVSKERAWFIFFTESGLNEASTSKTTRLHPKVGLLSLKPGRDNEKAYQLDTP
jgi:hypothetical protein